MNLVLYSHAKPEQNAEFDQEVVKLISNKESKILFIPSQTDSEGQYFKKFVDYYSSLGYSDFDYLDLDEQFKHEDLLRLAEYDVIYLSGGNTFYFLNRIKQTGADIKLREFAELPGKVLVGVSAGSMILTPTIMNTVIQHQIIGDFKELNTTGLSDFSGLGLVNFEFIPHFSQENKGAMASRYLPQTTNTVYGCPDGSGIIVKENEIGLFGPVLKLN